MVVELGCPLQELATGGNPGKDIFRLAGRVVEDCRVSFSAFCNHATDLGVVPVVGLQLMEMGAVTDSAVYDQRHVV